MLPDKFAIVFDVWCVGDTHDVAIFAIYSSKQPSAYDSVLLALSSRGEEDSQNAMEHFEFVQLVLSVSGKSWENVAALVGDNCSTNKALARRVEALFVSCFSH